MCGGPEGGGLNNLTVEWILSSVTQTPIRVGEVWPVGCTGLSESCGPALARDRTDSDACCQLSASPLSVLYGLQVM